VDEAEKYLMQSLALQEELETPASWTADVSERLRWLGDLSKQKRNFSQAREYYSRAVTTLARLSPEGIDYAESLAGLADVARLEGNLEAAAHYYEDALKALEGQTTRLGGSSEVRAGFRARHESIYREYIEVLLGLNKPELAFQVIERSRARTLLETLAAAHVDIHQGVDPGLIARERSLQADLKVKSQRRIHLLNDKYSEEELKAVEREISELTSEYQDVEAQIRSSSPVYAALTQPQPLSLAEIQRQLLDRDTVLLEYSLGEERSHVFVLSADSLEVVELPKRRAIEAASLRVYGLLTARNLRKKDENPAARQARIARAEEEYPAAAARLSRMVLAPIVNQLTGKRLLMVSDGALHYVSFAALPVSVRGKAPAPLAAQHEIINLPSASVLAVLRHERMGRESPSKTVAVLADPVFDTGDTRVKHLAVGGRRNGDAARGIDGSRAAVEESEKSLAFAHLTRSAADVGWQGPRRGEVYLPRLRFSRQEADAIAAATPPGQALEALDFQASRATAMGTNLANYRVVHFATHALLNSKHPELSGLVLSLVDERGRPRNGFLDLEDIYNLNLPAELVVLSACETGLGKEISGEGLVGLTRGFMYAGASRVMASLWKIDDRATAELMGHFYQAMVGQEMRPAAALRAAQLRMRKDRRWRSPYFWAAFQIQGEWK
jgi:CHAT domain-containing protein